MSKRGTEFIEQWVKDNFHADMPDQRSDRRPIDWAQQCLSAAVHAGIPREEIEEDFGNLEEFMERAIADAFDIAAEKSFRKKAQATKKMPQRPKGEKRPSRVINNARPKKKLGRRGSLRSSTITSER